MLKPGDAAPDFVLKDGTGKDIRLSSFSGRPIVLYFYPKDGTLGCTIQSKGLRDHYDTITTRHQAVVVGLSLDSPESHQQFQESCELPFLLLSDPEGRVHDLYEAWRTTLLGRSSLGVRRCTFIIDRDGIIRAVHKNVNVFSHAKAVLKDLDLLTAQNSWGQDNHVRKRKGKKGKQKPWEEEEET